MRLSQLLGLPDAVEDERLVERNRGIALDDDLGDAPAGSAEPAFSHRETLSPGATAMISASTPCSRSWTGLPARSGNVP